MNKPTPIIEKISFSKEDQENIDALLNGRPSKESIERMEKRGFDIENWLKRYRSPHAEYRRKRVRQEYYKGICCLCDRFPDYRVKYKLPDITLVELYCEEHKSQIPT
jgi:hypothetical protein